MAIHALTHIGICVSDLERSRAFYRDGLGFREVSRLAIDGAPTSQLMGVDDIELRCAFLERDGVRLELMYFQRPGCEGDGAGTTPLRRGLTHLALRVDDVGAECARLEAAGATIEHGSWVRNEAWGSEVVWVLDPDGVRIEVCYAPGDPFEPHGERV